MKKLILASLVIFALLLWVSGLVLAQPPDNAQGHAPDQILVKFKADIAEDIKARVHQKYGGRVVDVIVGIDVEVVRTPVDTVWRMVRAYKKDASIEFAEHDYIAEAIFIPIIPSDLYFGKQWGLNNEGQTGGTPDADIDAPEAWGVTRGSSGVKIAICDTGIDQNHEDFGTKIVLNKNLTLSRTVDDLYGHGTHVAGIAAAITNNGKGVAGVGFDSSLMNVKVLGDTGTGYYSWVASGIIWAADNGAKVINLSLGGTSPSSTLEYAVNYAWGKGSVLVAAAGNANTDALLYPAYYENCVAVAATDKYDAKASFSNYGTWVDIAAPGVGIFSTMPNHRNRIGILNYGSLSGTSMSTPHVAGVAALVFDLDIKDINDNGRINDEVRDRIETTAECVGTVGTICLVYGIERVNAYNAVTTP